MNRIQQQASYKHPVIDRGHGRLGKDAKVHNNKLKITSESMSVASQVMKIGEMKQMWQRGQSQHPSEVLSHPGADAPGL